MVLTQKPNLQWLIKTILAVFRLLFPRNMINCSPSWRGRNECRASAVNLISVHLLTVGTLIRSQLQETKTQKGCKRVIVCNGTRPTKEFYSQSFSYSVTKSLLAEAFFDPLIWAQKKNNCSSLSAIWMQKWGCFVYFEACYFSLWFLSVLMRAPDMFPFGPLFALTIVYFLKVSAGKFLHS